MTTKKEVDKEKYCHMSVYGNVLEFHATEKAAFDAAKTSIAEQHDGDDFVVYKRVGRVKRSNDVTVTKD